MLKSISGNNVVTIVALLLITILLRQSSANAFQGISSSYNYRTNQIIRSSSLSSSSTTQLYLFNFLNEGKKALVKSLAGDYDSIAIQERVNALISNNNVLMLSFTTCPYCIKAKSVLDSKNAKYTVIELDVDPDGKAIRAELGDLIGRTSVPAIWINKQFIGGCNDGPLGGIVTLNEQGKLDTMLKQASAI